VSLTEATVNSSSHALQIGFSAVFMLHDEHMYGHSAPEGVTHQLHTSDTPVSGI